MDIGTPHYGYRGAYVQGVVCEVVLPGIGYMGSEVVIDRPHIVPTADPIPGIPSVLNTSIVTYQKGGLGVPLPYG